MAAESMIERVAKMLAGLRASGVVLFGVPVEEKHRMMARAAIMAMREPDESMIEAGYEHQDVGLGTNPKPTWQAMIDAALKHDT